MTAPIWPFLYDLNADAFPDAVTQTARRWLLDLIGVAAGGRDLPMARMIRDHAAAHFASHETGVPMLFDARRVSPVGAALAGGMSIDALDAHDGHRLCKGHVGCGVLPALLAYAHMRGDMSAREFFTLFVLGYEIGTRAGVSLHSSVSDYHTSGAWIAPTCAVLGARALGLTPAQAREAAGIAEYHGPRSQMMRCIDHPTMVKDGSGWGAMAGVSAALLAQSGFTGAPALTLESDEVQPIWADLGQRWAILEQYYKPFPVCRWAQPAVQAVLDLRAQYALTAAQVERIEVVTFHASKRLAVTDPHTTEQAQYSTAFPVAAALVRGQLGVAEVTEAAFGDAEIRRLAASMQIYESEEYNARFPQDRCSHVCLHLQDGQVLQSPPTRALGDPETPPTQAQVVEKFHALAEPVLGRTRCQRIIELTQAMPSESSMNQLLAELSV